MQIYRNKQMTDPFSYQRLDQFQLPPNFRGRSAFIVQLWWITQATFFAWSPQFLYGWRRFLLRLFGAKIGRGVLMRPSARVTYPWKLSIGDFSWVGDEVELYTLGNIEIGEHVVISQRCYLCTGSHDPAKAAFDIYARPIMIHDQAWLASDVFISPGVTIGFGCVVGARSTVFHDLPAGKICYGSPAVPIKDRVMNE